MLAEKTEDFRLFTITLAPTVPVLKILTFHPPSKLAPGQFPTITGSFEQLSTKIEWVFQRVIDEDSGDIVAETPKIWTMPGEYPINVAPDQWNRPMPSHAWHLRFELKLWWI